ncbi:methyltransferase domain-containing protein [Streptomyces sp. NPDC016469]|uniref:methyltransferase domain-containing protein n=1 Tax=Streptomyces sp. NPDC016469 TaxID=3157191 RepID=UPI0033FBC37E
MRTTSAVGHSIPVTPRSRRTGPAFPALSHERRSCRYVSRKASRRAADALVAGFVVHLLDDPAVAVQEIRRVLAPGGVFSFSVPGPAAGGLTRRSPRR